MITIEVYEDTTGDRRWRIVAANGKIKADSGEGYKRMGKLTQSVERMFDDIKAGNIKAKVNGKPCPWPIR